MSILLLWYTFKSHEYLRRAVEQLAGCLAKRSKLSRQGQSTTAMQSQRKELLIRVSTRQGHAYSPTYRMWHSACT